MINKNDLRKAISSIAISNAKRNTIYKAFSDLDSITKEEFDLVKSDISKVVESMLTKDTVGKANGVASLDSNGSVPIKQLGNIDTTLFLIVRELPTTDIKTNKIYIVPNQDDQGNNIYVEYLYVENVWENLGEFKGTGASTAAAVTFDNAASGMNAVTAQAAIDELSSKIREERTRIDGELTELEGEVNGISQKVNGGETDVEIEKHTQINRSGMLVTTLEQTIDAACTTQGFAIESGKEYHVHVPKSLNTNFYTLAFADREVKTSWAAGWLKKVPNAVGNSKVLDMDIAGEDGYPYMLISYDKTAGEPIVTTKQVRGSIFALNTDLNNYEFKRREYNCTPTSGFYNALREISADGYDNSILYVREGEYDLYNELGGTAFANTITSGEWADYNVFTPKGLTIKGVGRVILKLNIPHDNLVSDSRAEEFLSALNIRKSVTIENVTIECGNCRYAVHIEGSELAENNDQEFNFIDCNINRIAPSYGKNAAIGIGINKGCTLNVKDCTLDSGTGYAVGGHLNNGSVIMNFDNSVIKGQSGYASWYMGTQWNSLISKVTFKNCLCPTILVDGNNTNHTALFDFVFFRTGTTITKTATIEACPFKAYDCEVVDNQ